MAISELILCSTLILAAGVRAQLPALRPENHAVLQRAVNQVTLNCGIPNTEPSTTGLGWAEYITNDGRGNTISLPGTLYDGDNYTLTEHDQNQMRRTDLNVLTPDLMNAGRYECKVYPSVEVAYAEIIVLGSKVQCSDDRLAEMVENDLIKFTCEVPYRGLWPPDMRWEDQDGQEAQNIQDEGIDGQLVKFTFTKTLTETDTGKTYSCKIGFQMPQTGVLPPDASGVTYARNAPVYADSCSTAQLNVLSPPRILEMNPKKDVYHPGDKITCDGKGNPAPEYRWENVDTHEILSSTRELMITEGMEGNLTVQCVVWNYIRGQEKNASEALSFEVKIPPTTTTSTTLPTPPMTDSNGSPTSDELTSGLSDGEIAGIVVACVVVVIIIIIIIIFCCCRTDPSKSSGKPAKPAGKPQHVDAIRHPEMVRPPPGGKPEIAYISEKPPPYDMGPPNRNSEGLLYPDLALDDTPRSRKPIQVYEPTDYSDFRRV